MTPGFYGKLPSAGDFVGRGWSAALRDGLDTLVRSALGALTAEGKRLAEVMPLAPALALRARPSVVATTGFMGVIVPSTDRVGREFTLCLGFETASDHEDATAAVPVEAIAALHALAQRAVEHALGADALLDALVHSEFADGNALWRTQPLATGDDTLPRLDAAASLVWMPAPAGVVTPAVRALYAMLQASAAVYGARLNAAGQCDGYFAARHGAAAREVAAWFDGEWATRGWTVVATPAGVAPGDDEDSTRPALRAVP